MNIFYLHNDPVTCVQQYPDKHVVKMILETAQLLCSAHHIIDSSNEPLLYKLTHKNHPSAVWARTSKGNYEWLHKLLVTMNDEYTHRYGKIHKVRHSGLEKILSTAPINIQSGVFSEPPQAMPDDVKNSSAIIAYQDYYNKYKTHLFAWKNRQVPIWVK